MTEFESAISDLDLHLFEKIPSQSTDHDKQSLLAIELAVRELVRDYTYLEIGSYLGGSIQPHLLDPLCRRIYSIDKRPYSQPDARGYDWIYQNNSTARMIELLSEVSPDTSKIITIDGDTKSIDLSQVSESVDLCFIDGEHTDTAVLSDFKFCLSVLKDNGAIVFHDAQITYNGIAACIEHLQKNDVKFNAYALPNIVFVIEIGEFALHKHAKIVERLTNNHESYLYSLQGNDEYRRFATRFPFGAMRRLMFKIRGGNVSE
jgi:predicted O-methyltransferase YrrM